MGRATTLTATAALALALLAGPALSAEGKDLQPTLRAALAKVYITSQGWTWHSPWDKGNPRRRSQRGFMIRPGLLLTPASGMDDQIMIEVSEANSARRYPASLVHVDYAANLALVKIDDDGLLSRMRPLPVGEPITIDSECEIWQLGSTDLVERFTGTVQKVAPQIPQFHLTARTTLADNGDGQVALADGKVVGMVFAVNTRRQEATILGLETIRHFLDDFDSGEYRGFGTGPLWLDDMLRDDLRAYHKVPDDQHGLLVDRVIEGRTGYGALIAGDVITHVRGFDLDDEGMFTHPMHGRIHVSYLLYCSTHPGDEVPARILRGGVPMDVKIPIRDWPLDEQRVPGALRDMRPPYLIAGGMVILELTGQPRGRSHILQQYQARSRWDGPSDRKRIVYVSRVLADPANKGLDEIQSVAILEVNGKKISGIGDVANALQSSADGYHVFTFEGIEPNYVIEADKLAEIDKRVADRYRIPEMSYLGEGD